MSYNVIHALFKCIHPSQMSEEEVLHLVVWVLSLWVTITSRQDCQVGGIYGIWTRHACTCLYVCRPTYICARMHMRAVNVNSLPFSKLAQLLVFWFVWEEAKAPLMGNYKHFTRPTLVPKHTWNTLNLTCTSIYTALVPLRGKPDISSYTAICRGQAR